MGEYTTFTCTSGETISVQTKFLETCPKPETYTFKDLCVEYKAPAFLHNPSGPAIEFAKNNILSFWINGKILKGEELDKAKNNWEFKNKLVETLKD